MGETSYQVAVMSPFDGSITAIFDPASFYDLRYSRLVNDIGVITLTLPYNNAFRTAFVLDSLVEVARTNPNTGLLAVEDCYLVRFMNRYRQGNEERYVVSGFQLNDLIRRRVVDPTDDPNAAGGFSTYAGPSDTVMYNYANCNLGPAASAPRRMPNLTIPVPAGVGLPVGYTLQFDDLFKAVFQDAAARGQMDFNIKRTTANNFELDIAVIGTDRRRSTNYPNTPFVQFDPLRGNLVDPNLTVDYKACKTVAYTLGAGQGAARQVLRVAGNGSADSPLNRIEYTVSAGQVAKGDTTSLNSAARASLLQNSLIQTFTMQLTADNKGAIYNLDWFLGDYVSVVYDEFYADLRITGVELYVTQAGETIVPSITVI